MPLLPEIFTTEKMLRSSTVEPNRTPRAGASASLCLHSSLLLTGRIRFLKEDIQALLSLLGLVL